MTILPTLAGNVLSDLARELREVDWALEQRSLRVSLDTVAWEPVPSIEAMPRERLLTFYYQMALTRSVDREIVKLSRKGLALGKHLMCTGNEATAVGAAAAARPTDWLTLAIRDLGAYLVRGITPTQILAQACGRVNGLTGGVDGSLHMGSRPARVLGLVSHLGTLIPVGAGCAFASRYVGSDDAVVSFSGDGATSTGDFHEGLNIASVLEVPLVIVIENNQWAFGTPTRLQYATPTLAFRALSYGPKVEGYCVDGTNVVTVFETVQRALERARQDGIISIIEAMSMRLEGHSLADPFRTYVPAEQLAHWHAKDPITLYRERLLASGVLSSVELDEVDRRIRAEVMSAALEAEAGDTPRPDALRERVFVGATHSADECVTPPNTGSRVPYYQAIQSALCDEMDRDDTLFLIGEDVGISNGAFKISEGLSSRYDGIDWSTVWNTKVPVRQRRVIDAPIAEAGFTGLALGAVLNGLRAVVEFQYADFASEAFKMIVNFAATETARGLGPIPIVFRLPSGWAPNTSIYHSANPESWFASTPGLKIVAPVTAFDAKGLLKAAIRDNNPVLFLEYKALYRTRPERLPAELNLPVPDGDYIVPIGKARLVRTGADLSLITYGSQVVRAMEAAAIVDREDGISVEVIDLRTIVPYDRGTVHESVRKTSKALVTCEAQVTGCFGNTLVADIAMGDFEHLDAPVQLLAAADTPVPFAPALEDTHLPTVAKLVGAIRSLAVM